MSEVSDPVTRAVVRKREIPRDYGSGNAPYVTLVVPRLKPHQLTDSGLIPLIQD